jgi:hypothetical protein
MPRCESALALRRSGRTLAQVALVEIGLARWTDAAAHLAEAARDQGNSWVQQNRAVLTDAMTATRPHVAELRVESSEAGATLRLNGQDRGALPLAGPLFLSPGAATLSVRATSGAEVTRALILRAGESSREFVSFVAAPVATVTAPPRRVEVPAPQVVPVIVRRSGTRPWAWASAGVAAAGLGLALVSWRLRAGVVSDFAARCPDGETGDAALVARCGTLRADAESAVGTWDALSAAGLVGGLAFAGVAAALFATSSSGDARRALRCEGIGELGLRCAVAF